jgi:hypothetical protein
MKVALCISSYLRTWKDNFSLLKSNLLDRYHPDVFIHTWNAVDSNNNNSFLDDVNHFLAPKKMLIESPIALPITDLMRRRNNNRRDINSVLSMFYGIKRADELRTSYEYMNGSYDCVIRFRGDIVLLEPLEIKENNLDKITIPKYGDYDGVNDQFAWSCSEWMKRYCSTYDNIEEFLRIEGYMKEVNFNPEELLFNNLKKYNMNLVRPEIKYQLSRMNGETLDNKATELHWKSLLAKGPQNR